MKGIDLKSMVIGFLAAGCAFLLMGQAGGGSQAGRYQLLTNSSLNGFVVFDTTQNKEFYTFDYLGADTRKALTNIK